jgi:hypothetical protein
MPGLLLPLGLLGLLALAVPLLVHLARRSEAEILDFAALRWLRAAPRPKSRVRFDEILLLLLRLLLLALLALMLAQPVWRGVVDRRDVVAVMPGVDMVEARAVVGAAGADVRAVWLAPGFPDFGEVVPDAGAPLSELRAFEAGLEAGTRLTILTPTILQGVDGATPRLGRAVEWRVLEGAMAAPVMQAGKLRLVVMAEAGDARLRWFSAVAAGLEAEMVVRGLAAPVEAARDGDVLVWLGAGAVPAAVREWGGAVLVMAAAEPVSDAVVVWRDGGGAIAERAGDVVRLVRPMTAAAMPVLLEPDFPGRLRDVLLPRAAPARALAEGMTPMAGGVRMAAAGLDLRGWLALLIAIGWLGERWWATRLRRFAA